MNVVRFLVTFIFIQNNLVGQTSNCEFVQVDSILTSKLKFEYFQDKVDEFFQKDSNDFSVLYTYEIISDVPATLLQISINQDEVTIINGNGKFHRKFVETIKLREYISGLKYGSSMSICNCNQSILYKRLIVVKRKGAIFYKYEGFCDSLDILKENSPILFGVYEEAKKLGK